MKKMYKKNSDSKILPTNGFNVSIMLTITRTFFKQCIRNIFVVRKYQCMHKLMFHMIQWVLKNTYKCNLTYTLTQTNDTFLFHYRTKLVDLLHLCCALFHFRKQMMKSICFFVSIYRFLLFLPFYRFLFIYFFANSIFFLNFLWGLKWLIANREFVRWAKKILPPLNTHNHNLHI